MANSPPKAAIHDRSDSSLLEDLCRELRNVAVFDNTLPDGDRVKQHIEEVCAIHRELVERRIDIAPRITTLSKETSWRMQDLLGDCLAYPTKQPYVKEPDGVRRTLRCTRCRSAERPPDAKLFWFCESCMKLVASALHDKTERDGIVIFRSYTTGARCSHADAETTLASEWYSESIYGVCERCVYDEIARRRKLPPLDR